MMRKEMKPVKQEPKPITIEASGLMTWDIQYGIEDKVLVGYSLENAEWVNLKESMVQRFSRRTYQGLPQV